MLENLLLTAALMGWAGGPHCLIMCGAPCTIIAQTPAARSAAVSIAWFQLGRLLSYAAMGTLAAAAMQGLGWLTSYSAALRPVWSMFHGFALGLGLWLLLRGQLPLWAQTMGRYTWQRIQAIATRLGPTRTSIPLISGLFWGFLPCGLLYSALVVAALSAQPWQGALVMATFALTSGAVLALGPWVLLRWGLRLRGSTWGLRLVGASLAFSAGAALYLGLLHNQAPWC